MQNIKNNKSLYIPYVVTSSITIFMFYIFLAMQNSTDIINSRGGPVIISVLGLGKYIVGIFSVIFLVYTNQFLVRNRDRELGLINMLGADKKGISKIMAYESIILTIINLSIGITASLIFSTGIFLLISRVLSLELTKYIYIDFKSIGTTILVYLVIFIVVLIGNTLRARKLKPLDMLKESEKGEKEPKASILITIIGIICMVVGYILAQRVNNIIEAIPIFFIAVILVIIGTYLLFTTVSIAILKILKKNKKVYYKSKNMTFISTMIFRMKQNAVSLANICIISTMVLVMLVSTTSLIASGDYLINLFYPSDISIEYKGMDIEKDKEIEEIFNKNIENKDLKITGYYNITGFGFGGIDKGNGEFDLGKELTVESVKNTKVFSVYNLDDYNKVTGKNIKLKEDEIILYQNQGKELENISIENAKFRVKDNLKEIDGHFVQTDMLTFPIGTIIVDDYSELLKNLSEKVGNIDKEALDSILAVGSVANINIEGDTKLIRSTISEVNSELNEKFGLDEDGIGLFRIQDKYSGEADFIAMHTGIYIVTILLSIIFLVAMIMIIYYKQLSEGLEDAKNIDILKKIGMGNKEIKKQVGKQTRTIFFMPLIISIVHLLGASKLIYFIIGTIGIANKSVFIKAEIGTIAMYVIFYIIVYKLSSNAYYNIINKKNI